MSIPDDADPDALIARLSGPLTPDARQAFRAAAEDALARVPCQGEGAVYRAIAPLQRAYFTPPGDQRAAWDVSHDLRPSKMRDAPAIGHSREQRLRSL